MGNFNIHSGFKPAEALKQAGQLGKHALAKLNSAERRPASLPSSSLAISAQDELDSDFKQHPDLFRDSSLGQADWNDFTKTMYAGCVHTLLIREQQTTSLFREYLLSDSRLHVCGVAERLGDACRQIRKQSYQVIVLAINNHMHDMVSLLDLMNSSNPRAKAVAVLESAAIAQLQHMIHPKVLGYVAAQDAAQHLSDAVMEVSQGRFTASPAISDIVFSLTSSYLAEREPAISPSLAQRLPSDLPSGYESANNSAFASSTFASSQLHSSFLNSSPTSTFGESSSLRHRTKVNTASLSERETGILSLIAGGLSSAEIAEQLAISVPTVNAHIRNIFSKLGVHTRAQAIHVGIAQGMIEVQ
jgi:DNA-binding NarL/FixJ family response regulator